MATSDKVSGDLAGEAHKVHVSEAFKSYRAQLVRAQAKYPVGNPVYNAYASTIAECDKARDYVLSKL